MSRRGRGRGERPPRRRFPKGATRRLPPIELDQAPRDKPERGEQPSAETLKPSPPQPSARPTESEGDQQPQPSSAPLATRSDLWLVLVLVVLAAVSFLPALSNEFIWEDYPLVVDNPLLRSPGGILAMFGRPFLPMPEGVNSYHPLTMLTYWVDFQVWRLNPEGYHSTNLILHLMAVVLMYAAALQLLRRRSMAFAAGAIFAVHPVHVQSVAYIAGRSQLLATCLALFAVLAYGSYVNSFSGASSSPTRARAYYAVSLIAFALALFAHAAVVALVILLPLYEIALSRQRLNVSTTPRFLAPYAGFAAAVLLYLVGRWWALGYHLAVGFDPRAWPAHLYSAPGWALRALELLVLPLRSRPYSPAQLAPGLLRLEVLTAIAALAVWLKNLSRRAAFGAWWTLLTLAPTLNLLPLATRQLAERDLYLSSIGIAIVIGWAVGTAHDCVHTRCRDWRGALLLAAFAGIIVLGMTASWRRTHWYSDQITFFTRMSRAAPELALPHFNLGNVYLVQGQARRAIREYKLAIERLPSSRAYHNLGNAYMAERRYPEAAQAYSRALEFDPTAQVTADALLEALQAQAAEERAGQPRSVPSRSGSRSG